MLKLTGLVHNRLLIGEHHRHDGLQEAYQDSGLGNAVTLAACLEIALYPCRLAESQGSERFLPLPTLFNLVFIPAMS